MPDNLYIHLSDDGGIFLLWRDSGHAAWVTQQHLITALDELKASNGRILYSTDPSKDPLTTIARNTLNLIKAYSLPMVFAAEPHPDTRRERNCTTLMLVAYAGNETKVQDLIERGSDLEAIDTAGYTALMYACNDGRDRIVDILLAAGANPNARAADNSTPLMFAAQHGHADIVRQLIAAGADPSALGDHGLSALGFAEQNGHVEIAQYLKSVTTSESLKST
jgi:ankyrin repeat protein